MSIPPRSGDETTNTARPVSGDVVEGTKRPYLIIISGVHLGDMHKVHKARMVLGRSPAADIRIVDDGISREHLEILVDAERVRIRDLGSTNGTYRNGSRVDETEVDDGDKISIGSTTVLKFSYYDTIDEAYGRFLHRSAIRDALTGALKREFFLERLDGDVAYAIRHSSAIGLILWDLDEFKAVNDHHGHLAGDLVLEAMARAIEGVIRREDAFGRYGGEEFALACRGANPDGLRRTAERLRKAIENTTIAIDSHLLRVTASFGVALCPSLGVTSISELISVADGAMYKAKALGRNRVEIGPQTAVPGA